jgi:hypothetical protein
MGIFGHNEGYSKESFEKAKEASDDVKTEKILEKGQEEAIELQKQHEVLKKKVQEAIGDLAAFEEEKLGMEHRVVREYVSAIAAQY